MITIVCYKHYPVTNVLINTTRYRGGLSDPI